MTAEQENKLISLNCEEIELFWSSFLSSQPEASILYNLKTQSVQFENSLLIANRYSSIQFKTKETVFTLSVLFSKLQAWIDSSSDKNILAIPTEGSILRKLTAAFIEFLNSTGLYEISATEEVKVLSGKTLDIKKAYIASFAEDIDILGYLVIENYDNLSREMMPQDTEQEAPQKSSPAFSDFVADVEDTLAEISEKLPPTQTKELKGLKYDPLNPKLVSHQSIDLVQAIHERFAKSLNGKPSDFFGKDAFVQYRVASIIEEFNETAHIDNVGFSTGTVHIGYGDTIHITTDNALIRKIVSWTCGGDRSTTTSTGPLTVAERAIYLAYLKFLLNEGRIAFPREYSVNDMSFQSNLVLVQRHLRVCMEVLVDNIPYGITLYYSIPQILPALRKLHQPESTSAAISSMTHNIRIPLLIRFEDEPCVQAGYVNQLRENIFIPLDSKKIVVTEKEA